MASGRTQSGIQNTQENDNRASTKLTAFKNMTEKATLGLLQKKKSKYLGYLKRRNLRNVKKTARSIMTVADYPRVSGESTEARTCRTGGSP